MWYMPSGRARWEEIFGLDRDSRHCCIGHIFLPTTPRSRLLERVFRTMTGAERMGMGNDTLWETGYEDRAIAERADESMRRYDPVSSRSVKDTGWTTTGRTGISKSILWNNGKTKRQQGIRTYILHRFLLSIGLALCALVTDPELGPGEVCIAASG